MTRRGFAGADWLVGDARRPVSALGREVADVLGDVLAGLYHLPDAHDNDWTTESFVEILWGGDLSTFDADALTHLVVEAHDRCLRLSISARTMWAYNADRGYRIERGAEGPTFMADCQGCDGAGTFADPDLGDVTCLDCAGKGKIEVWLHQTHALMLMFHKRVRESDATSERHPTMEAAIAHVRGGTRHS